MDQGFLFDTDKDILTDEARKLARRNDPETSKEAARRVVDTGKLTENQVKCLRAVVKNPMSTYAEIARFSGLADPEPARRLPDMRRRGYVQVVSARECKVRKSKCQTWMATAKGLEWVQSHPE